MLSSTSFTQIYSSMSVFVEKKDLKYGYILGWHYLWKHCLGLDYNDAPIVIPCCIMNHRSKTDKNSIIILSRIIVKKLSCMFKYMLGLSGNDYRVSKHFKSYLFVIVIIWSLKWIGQFQPVSIND